MLYSSLDNTYIHTSYIYTPHTHEHIYIYMYMAEVTAGPAEAMALPVDAASAEVQYISRQYRKTAKGLLRCVDK